MIPRCIENREHEAITEPRTQLATLLAPHEEPLQRELQSVTSKLDATIDRVCDARADAEGVRRLDTGELIRVEETLAVAAEIAKEAVTLRRKLRSAAPSDTDRGAVPADGGHDRAG